MSNDKLEQQKQLKEKFVEWCMSHVREEDKTLFLKCMEYCDISDTDNNYVMTFDSTNDNYYISYQSGSGRVYLKNVKDKVEYNDCLTDITFNKKGHLLLCQCIFNTNIKKIKKICLTGTLGYVIKPKTTIKSENEKPDYYILSELDLMDEYGLTYKSIDLRTNKKKDALYIPMYDYKKCEIKDYFIIGNTGCVSQYYDDDEHTCFIMKSKLDLNREYADILANTKNFLIVRDYISADRLYQAMDGTKTIIVTFHDLNTSDFVRDFQKGIYVWDDFCEEPIEGIKKISLPADYDIRKYSDIYGLDSLKDYITSQLDSIRSKRLDLDELFKPRVVDIDLISGVLPRASKCLLFARSGSGKSFLSLDLALHLCSDMADWNGHSLMRGRNVLYLCSEGFDETCKRLLVWCQYHNIDKERIRDRIAIVDFKNKLDTKAGMESTLKFISDNYPTMNFNVIIIDTSRRAMAGDENSNGDVDQFIQCCSDLASNFEDCSFLAVHHCGKDDSSELTPRGAQTWMDAVDHALKLSKDGRNGIAKLSTAKCRGITTGNLDFRFKLEEMPIVGWATTKGESITSAIVKPVTMADVTAQAEPEKQPQKNIDRLEKISKAVKIALKSKKILPDEDGYLTMTKKQWENINDIEAGDNNDFKAKDKNGKPRGFEAYLEKLGWGILHFDKAGKLASVSFKLSEILPDESENY